jgi:hypothetical protein
MALKAAQARALPSQKSPALQWTVANPQRRDAMSILLNALTLSANIMIRLDPTAVLTTFRQYKVDARPQMPQHHQMQRFLALLRNMKTTGSVCETVLASGPVEPVEPAEPQPGDEAPPGTPGTGEGLCRECGGRGVNDAGQTCPSCSGTGHITVGIGGA